MLHLGRHITTLIFIASLSKGLVSCDFVFENYEDTSTQFNQRLEISLWQNEFLTIIAANNLKLLHALKAQAEVVSNNTPDQTYLFTIIDNCEKIQSSLEHIAKHKNISIPTSISSLFPLPSDVANFNRLENKELSAVLNNQLSAIQTLKKFSTDNNIIKEAIIIEQYTVRNLELFSSMHNVSVLQANLNIF